ncbi:MAG: RNA methyltransferase [Promethearchaeota archaeon]
MNKKKRKLDIGTFQETKKVPEYKNLSFTVILVKPEHSGNVGAIARVMENFNFKNLVIFNPIETEENILSYNTQGFAMHGKEILFNAEIIKIQNQNEHLSEFVKYLKRFDYVIGTTASGKSYSNIRRLAVFPDNLTFPISSKPFKIAILFGRESRGLTNEEISFADVILRIPTNSDYSALNLSHACGIILYEIFKKVNTLRIGKGKHPVMIADREERLILLEIIQNIIKKLKIRTYKEDRIFFAFRNVFGRSIMSKKELSLILGVFSKVNDILNKKNLYNN